MALPTHQVVVTYLHHSAFLVSGAGFCLIFDYTGGEPNPETPEGAAVHKALSGEWGKPVVLASHAHGDHFDPIIAQWAERGQCDLVLSGDIERGYPAQYIGVGGTLKAGPAQVTAFGSTDQGVSFLVEAGDVRIFHAGDLNFWHWRDESSAAEVEVARRHFLAVMDTLPRGHLDLAFFPVDGRLGTGHDDGAVYFAHRFQPKYLVPMHWWDDESVPQRFAKSAPSVVNVIAPIRRGQSCTIRT